MHEPAYKFPWAGVRGQILVILAGLLQPPPGQSGPGNAEVQMQVVRHNGMVSLLNCCVYDDHNRYARERVQICLKWLMDGSEAANNFLKELVGLSTPPNLRPSPPSPGGGPVPVPTAGLRIDGIGGEVKVQVRSASAPSAVVGIGTGSNRALGPGLSVGLNKVSNNMLPPIQPQATTRSRSEELLRDIINLADEAARLAMGQPAGEETEEEDFI
jgi:hypothetical protein